MIYKYAMRGASSEQREKGEPKNFLLNRFYVRDSERESKEGVVTFDSEAKVK